MPCVASEQLELELTRRAPRPRAKRASAPPEPERLLESPDALLTRSHLRALGLERRAIDAVFRALPVVALPGYSRPLIRARDYVELVATNTYRGDRVRPMAASTAGGPRLG
jgi:hypothetical protein